MDALGRLRTPRGRRACVVVDSLKGGGNLGVPPDGLRKWGTAKYVGVAWDTLAGVCHGRFGLGGGGGDNGGVSPTLVPWYRLGWALAGHTTTHPARRTHHDTPSARRTHNHTLSARRTHHYTPSARQTHHHTPGALQTHYHTHSARRTHSHTQRAANTLSHTRAGMHSPLQNQTHQIDSVHDPEPQPAPLMS